MVSEIKKNKKLTKSVFERMMTKLITYTDVAEYVGEQEKLDRLADFTADIEKIFQAYSKPVPERAGGKGEGEFYISHVKSLVTHRDISTGRWTKFTREQLLELASQREIDSMWALWVEKFIPSNEKDSEEEHVTDTVGFLATQAPVNPVEQLSPDDIGYDDLGVSAESKLSPEKLREVFGVQDNTWFGFNAYHHAGTLNPWDNEEEWKKLMESAEEMEKKKVITRFGMKWHQLVGVMAMVRLTLSVDATDEEREGKGYVLLADGVGAGKTCQVIAFITLLKQLRLLTKKGVKRPAIFRMCHFYYLLCTRSTEHFV
jgi:hypothetical protein